MFLYKLELKNFRSYENCEVVFPTQKTIFVGKNAQGKTNILESIYYLALLSSFRASNDSELMKWGSSFTDIKAESEKFDSKFTLEVLINPPKNKILKVNSLKKTGSSNFIGNLLVVSFGINDLLLLRGTPSDRRKWLDDAIGQIYPAYNSRLSKYNKVRTQRNNFLKELKGNIYLTNQQEDMLSVWDEQLIVTGSNIIHLRQKYLKEIQQRACDKHKKITLEAENLLIYYNSTVSKDFNTADDNILTPEEISIFYKNVLSVKRNEEIIRAQSVAGPHRDDISFCLNNIDAKTFASQGQQRTIVLSLKLAELDFIYSIVGEYPILLLDDVLAELDTSRQNFLLNSISDNIQTIITTVDISGFESNYLKNVTVYDVKNSEITRR